MKNSKEKRTKYSRIVGLEEMHKTIGEFKRNYLKEREEDQESLESF